MWTFPTVDNWLNWLVFSGLLFVGSTIIYFIFGKKFDADMEPFWEKFEEDLASGWFIS